MGIHRNGEETRRERIHRKYEVSDRDKRKECVVHPQHTAATETVSSEKMNFLNAHLGALVREE